MRGSACELCVLLNDFCGKTDFNTATSKRRPADTEHFGEIALGRQTVADGYFATVDHVPESRDNLFGRSAVLFGI